MGIYRDKTSYKAHDFNTSTFLIDGETKAEGIQSIRWEFDDDQYDSQVVADGTGISVRNASRRGTVTVEFLAASPTNTVLWNLQSADSDEGFEISMSDTAIPELKASARVYISKNPMLEKTQEHPTIEWVFKSVYLEVKGAGYALVSAT